MKITQHQTWQAFIQESICTIAAASNLDLELKDRLLIEEVTIKAFSCLGDNGLIQAAQGHACSECSQRYKRTVDIISDSNVIIADHHHQSK